MNLRKIAMILRLRTSRYRVVALLCALIVLSHSRAGESQTPPAADTTSVEALQKPAPETVADLRAIEDRVTQLVPQLMNCTVSVQTGKSQGSGVIISPDGHILSVAHVAGKPGEAAMIRLANGRTVVATVLGADSKTDTTLLQLSGTREWSFVTMATEESKVGHWCLALGHPQGYQKGRKPVLRLGRVVLHQNQVLQTDCTLVGGDSGGPLVNMKGELIGIHSRISIPTTWNFHIPVATFTDRWLQLAGLEVENGKEGAQRPTLGIQGEDHADGCRIVTVFPKSVAAKAGLKPGDVIVKFGEKELSGLNDLKSQLASTRPGDKTTVVFLRDGERIESSVILGER